MPRQTVVRVEWHKARFIQLIPHEVSIETWFVSPFAEALTVSASAKNGH